jgi:hypothetical protein
MAIKKENPYQVKGFRIITPKGAALFCHVVEAQTDFNEKGTYSTMIVCDPEEPSVQKLINQLEELRDTAYEETVATLGPVKSKGITKADVYKEDCDAEGNATGLIRFKLKLDNVADALEKGWTASITVIDASKRPINPVPLVGNGSIIRCAGFAKPYYMGSTKSVGVSLKWDKMQIIDLVSFSGGGDEFDDETDSDESFESPAANSSDNDASDF